MCGVLAAMGILLPGNDIAASALIPLIDTKNKTVKTAVKNVNKITVKNGEKSTVKMSSEVVGEVMEGVSNGAVSSVAALTVGDILADESGCLNSTVGDVAAFNGTSVHDHAANMAVTLVKSDTSDGSGAAISGVCVTEECSASSGSDSSNSRDREKGKGKENGCSSIAIGTGTETEGMEIAANTDSSAELDHTHDGNNHVNGRDFSMSSAISDTLSVAESCAMDVSAAVCTSTVTSEDNCNGIVRISSDNGEKVKSESVSITPENAIKMSNHSEMLFKLQQKEVEKDDQAVIAVVFRDAIDSNIVKIETDNGREMDVEKEVEVKDENETESDTDDVDTLDLKPNEGVLEYLERRWGDLLQNYLKEEELRSKLRILQENIAAAAAAQANICASSYPSSSSFASVPPSFIPGSSSFPLSINTDLGNGIEKYGDGNPHGINQNTDLSLDYSGYSPSNMSTSLFLFGSEELDDSYPVSPALLLSPTVAISIAKAHATMSNSQFFPENEIIESEELSKLNNPNTIENHDNSEMEISTENNGKKETSSSLNGNDNIIVNEESNTSDENFSILMQSSLADDFSPEFQEIPKQEIMTYPTEYSPVNGNSGENGDFEGVFSSNPGSSFFELNNGNSSAEMKTENEDSYNDAILNFLSGDNIAAGDVPSTGIVTAANSDSLSGVVSSSVSESESVGNVDTAGGGGNNGNSGGIAESVIIDSNSNMSNVSSNINNTSITTNNNNSINNNNNNSNNSNNISSSSSRAGSKSTAKRTSNQRLWKINPYLFPSQTQLFAFSDHENEKSIEGDNAVVSCSKITVKCETDYSTAALDTINEDITEGKNNNNNDTVKVKSPERLPLPSANSNEINLNGTTTLQKLFEIDTENLNRETNIVTCESINNLNTMKNVKINNNLKNNHKIEPTYGSKMSSRSAKELKILLSDPEKVLSSWMSASHEEVCALELEESIIRR